MAGRRWLQLSAALVELQALAKAACSDYVLISARGTFEPQGPSVAFTGMINATLAAVPNGIEYDTVYPASTNLTGAFYGVQDVISYIDAGVKACPNQKYALLGYSQGATVIDVALHNFTDPSSAALKAIQAVVVVGNPGHVPGAQANVDAYGSNGTRNGTGWYLLGGSGAIPDLYYTRNKVLDICIQGDHVCELPANGSGGVTGPHLQYGSTYIQTMGGEFLIEKLDEALPTTPAPNGTWAHCNATNSTTSTTLTSSAAYLQPFMTLCLALVVLMGLA